MCYLIGEAFHRRGSVADAVEPLSVGQPEVADDLADLKARGAKGCSDITFDVLLVEFGQGNAGQV